MMIKTTKFNHAISMLYMIYAPVFAGMDGYYESTPQVSLEC